MHAFKDVLRKRQSGYGKIINWLDEKIQILRTKEGESCGRMSGIVGEKGKGSEVL